MKRKTRQTFISLPVQDYDPLVKSGKQLADYLIKHAPSESIKQTASAWLAQVKYLKSSMKRLDGYLGVLGREETQVLLVLQKNVSSRVPSIIAKQTSPIDRSAKTKCRTCA